MGKSFSPPPIPNYADVAKAEAAGDLEAEKFATQFDIEKQQKNADQTWMHESRLIDGDYLHKLGGIL